VRNEDLRALLSAYDAQLRAHVHDRLPESVRVERDGPLLRTVGFADRGMVEYRDLEGLEGGELDELIARQVRIFAERGESFEWKLHGHDRPADLTERLRAAGFVPEDMETVVIAPVSAIGIEASVPDGVVVREVSEPVDLGRIEQLEQAIWGESEGWIVDSLGDERAADPDGLRLCGEPRSVSDERAVDASAAPGRQRSAAPERGEFRSGRKPHPPRAHDDIAGLGDEDPRLPLPRG
jgi:hypothetical protein